MAAILHVTQTGHKCANPLTKWGAKAGNIQAGERLAMGGWELWASLHAGRYVYIVCRVGLTGDHYEFSNFNCAAAKLAELGA